MRNLLLSLVTALALTCQVFSQNPAKAASTFEQRLIEQQQVLLRAAETKNAAAVERAVSEEFRGIGPNGAFYDKSELVESARQGVPEKMRAYDFQVIKLNDASAVVAYNLIAPGEHPRYCHMADTWAKVGTRWELKFRQITPNLWSENDVD